MYSYSLQGLGGMIGPASARRVDAYTRSLTQAIGPETVVLEIGTGFGFFALIAARAGARHVYAVEPNPLIQVGRELARANGCADRITFIQGLSTAISLPEPADVIVSDIRGALPWLADHLPSILDARQRHLKPGGLLIPGRDSVWAAVVHAPTHYERLLAPWRDTGHGLDLAAARKRVLNRWGKAHITPEALLTPPQCWATLDYATLTAPDAKGQLCWEIKQAGVAHGLSLWFESELAPGVTLSNAPDQPHIPIYSQQLFPWLQPVALAPGDEVDVTLQAKRVENRYEWMWATTIRSADRGEKARFRQFTFDAQAWTPEMLRQ